MKKEETFGDFVRKHRESLKMGSRELSKLVNKGASYISQIENGRNKKPDYRVAWALLNTFNIDEDKKENILNSFGIYEPENHQSIDDAYFKESLLAISEELKQPSSDIIFSKRFSLEKREMLTNQLMDINKYLYTIIDFNPDKAISIINNLHKSLAIDTSKIIIGRMRELLNSDSLDLSTSISLPNQLKEELTRRGITELITLNSEEGK